MAKKDLPPGAQKATGMEVNISGFFGVHPIQIGVAYWYRGHYIYSRAGVPVEPIPFAAKKGLHIVGTTFDTASPILEVDSHGIRNESKVAALQRSMVHSWEEQESNKKDNASTGEFGGLSDDIPGLTPSEHSANSE